MVRRGGPARRCYGIRARGSPPHCLALEDLRPAGFTMADRHEPLDAAHCRLALHLLARLHGASMALEHADRAAFNALRDSVDDPYANPDMVDQFLAVISSVEEAPGTADAHHSAS